MSGLCRFMMDDGPIIRNKSGWDTGGGRNPLIPEFYWCKEDMSLTVERASPGDCMDPNLR
jgi:hypothetical protein